jgi:hypothetical protein
MGADYGRLGLVLNDYCSVDNESTFGHTDRMNMDLQLDMINTHGPTSRRYAVKHSSSQF